MKKKSQRILVIVLAVALLLSVLFPALAILADATVSKDDINNLKNEIEEIQDLKKKVEQQLKELRGDMSKAQEQVDLIQGQIILTEQGIAFSQDLLDQFDTQIAIKEEEIDQLEQQEAEQYAQFCSHVRWLEETGSVSYLSILFQAGSFSELLDYAMLIADIMDYSNSIIDDLETTQNALSEVKDALESDRAQQAQAHEELQNQRAELAARMQEAQALYDEIAGYAAEISAKAKQLAADEAAMTKELKAAEQQYAAQIAALQNTGEWYWPLPGIYYISSIFGGRYSPINGRWESHTGTDIPAARGTEIHAAQGGVVTVSKWNVSYGWYCMISHGNGKTTLYAHMMQAPTAKEGQTVKKGQVIGYVGSTGDSTGNHLHFELRINGERSNVLKLYPNLPYTGPYVNEIKKQLKK